MIFFSLNRAKSLTKCVYKWVGVCMGVWMRMSAYMWKWVWMCIVRVCESLGVWVHLDVNVCICVNSCVCGYVCDWVKERRCLENFKKPESHLAMAGPINALFAITPVKAFPYLSHAFDSLATFSERERRARSDVWLSGLTKMQEARGWFFARGLICLHISPYIHPCIPCPQNKQMAELAFTPLCWASPSAEKI